MRLDLIRTVYLHYTLTVRKPNPNSFPLFPAPSGCGQWLTVTPLSGLGEYAGSYVYAGEYSNAPYYSKEVEALGTTQYLYRNSANENWHFYTILGSPFSAYYAIKSDCPSDSLTWYTWTGSEWVSVPLAVNISTYQNINTNPF